MSRTVENLYQRHRLTVEDYHRMGEAGILDEDARVELIEGEIVDMAPIGSPHAGMVRRLTHLLSRELRESAIVSVQNPVILGEHSEPEPDLALLVPREDFYTISHPRSQDVLLIIEVSDTTVRYDREVKVPLYARGGVPEVWLLDLDQKVVEVYREPGEQEYGQLLRRQPGERVFPVRLPRVSLRVASLWPKT